MLIDLSIIHLPIVFGNDHEVKGAFHGGDGIMRDPCVFGGCFDIGMAQKFLDDNQGNTGFKQMSGKRMPEHVNASGLFNTGNLFCFTEFQME